MDKPGHANAFDPFPYILLNLALSMVAAIQAPVIMMSQNRQSSKDRLKADLDYEVNLKAELEVAHLHEKTDRLYETLGERLTRIEKSLDQIWVLLEKVLRTLEVQEGSERER